MSEGKKEIEGYHGFHTIDFHLGSSPFIRKLRQKQRRDKPEWRPGRRILAIWIGAVGCTSKKVIPESHSLHPFDLLQGPSFRPRRTHWNSPGHGLDIALHDTQWLHIPIMYFLCPAVGGMP
jgi:hypothetical protein